MSLTSTPSANRTHIGIFGKRNAGKSSLINALTSQNLAIVSDVKGTTTDPVLKSMELLPLGPVVLIDTPGLDDEGALGELRIQKAYQMLNKTDIAVLVVDGTSGMTDEDMRILERIRTKKIPHILVFNKCDLPGFGADAGQIHVQSCISVSAQSGLHIHELKKLLAGLAPSGEPEIPIIGDLISPMDTVVLVVPIDAAAPKGRLILPQQQTIRDILENHALALTVQDTELKQTLAQLPSPPKMVVTDSQAFAKVALDTPADVPLTSFSILFARHKGNLAQVTCGARTLDELQDGDRILISEGCTHHHQCDDIGTVKLPRMIRSHTGRDLQFEFTSGTEFPTDLSPYRLVIHCGGCMLNEREMKYRLACAKDQKIPITNYGIAIAHIQGILRRSVELFEKEIAE